MFDTGREIPLREGLEIVRKHSRLVYGFFFAVLVGVALVTFLSTPQYEATTKVMIERVEPSDLTDRYRTLPQDPDFYETQFQLVKSLAVARRVVDNLALEDRLSVVADEKDEAGFSLKTMRAAIGQSLAEAKKFVLDLLPLGEDSEAKPEETKSRREIIAQTISAGIDVRPVANSRIVNVSYFSPDPVLAADVANAVVTAYVEETLDLKVGTTRRQLSWMKEKAESEAQRLKRTEKLLHDYMGASDILTLENRMAITPEKLSAISAQLVRSEFRRKELEALYNKVRSGSGYAENVTIIAADPALQSIRAQIVTTEKEIMELSNKYGRKHPVIKKALGDLEVLKRKKSQEISRLVQSIKNDYELALANEENLKKQLEEAKAEALQLKEKYIHYEAMAREVDTNRKLFDALTLKMKEGNITGETQAVNLSVVESAEPPLEPARPMKALNLALGGFIGLFGGVGLAFFREYLDNSVNDPERTEAYFSVPVLGIISRCPGTRESGNEAEQIVLKDPLSVHAESYKSLRAVLLSPKGGAPKRILITSSSAGEGKTTTAVNLALVLAQAEMNVLLVDCDLRKPRIHTIMNLDNQVGLSSYLGGEGSHIVVDGPIPHLKVIPSGPIPPNPSELLSSKNMKKLFGALSEKFDIIICDSPPMMPVADAIVLSPLCDGSLLVVNANETTYDMTKQTIKQFKDIKVNVTGIVINNINVKSNKYYKAYTSYYGSVEAQKAATV